MLDTKGTVEAAATKLIGAKNMAVAKSVLDTRTGQAVKRVIEKIDPKNSLSKNINKVISGDSKDIIRKAVLQDVGGVILKQAVGKMIPADKGKMKINKPPTSGLPKKTAAGREAQKKYFAKVGKKRGDQSDTSIPSTKYSDGGGFSVGLM